MKILISMKTPDAAEHACRQAATTFDENDNEIFNEELFEQYMISCRRWLRYGEYMDVEVDLEAGNARIIPQKDS